MRGDNFTGKMQRCNECSHWTENQHAVYCEMCGVPFEQNGKKTKEQVMILDKPFSKGSVMRIVLNALEEAFSDRQGMNSKIWDESVVKDHYGFTSSEWKEKKLMEWFEKNREEVD